LLQEVFQHYRGSSHLLHAFVVMPDHFHLLLTPHESLERAMQNIKGGSSFRAKRAFDGKHEIWQPGFSDHRIRDDDDWTRHVDYIRRNPVQSGLCERPDDYLYLKSELDAVPQRLKPPAFGESDGGAEAPPLQRQSTQHILD
jgi:putative transposase